MKTFREYLTFKEIADNFGLEPPKENPIQKKPALQGVWSDDEKPPTAKSRKKPTRDEILRSKY
jgi:hypothetical protein